jgi:uncharacterized protein (DUF4415 family)
MKRYGLSVRAKPHQMKGSAMRKRQTQIDQSALEIPEIPRDATLLEPRRRPAANARMPRKKVALELDVDLVAWFESEARRGGLNHNDHINKALRQYVTDLVGDKPSSPALNKRQRQEIRKLIDETLTQKGFIQYSTT